MLPTVLMNFPASPPIISPNAVVPMLAQFASDPILAEIFPDATATTLCV